MFVGCLVASLAVASASAQERDGPRVELHYSAPEACPDAQGFRDHVVGRLGYDPFDASADSAIEITIRTGFRATIVLSGVFEGRRQLGPTASCSELVGATAATVSILLDPLAIPRAEAMEDVGTERVAPTPPVETSETSETSEEVPPAALVVVAGPVEVTPSEPPPDRVRAPVDGLAVLELGGAIGAGPEPSFEGALLAGLEIVEVARIELGVRTRHTVATVANDPTRVSTWAGAASGCGRYLVFLACLDLELGAIEAYGASASAWALHAALGVRAGIEAPIAPGIAFRALAGGWLALTRPVLRVGGRPEWDGEPAFGSIIVGLAARPGEW